jgi:hypothetical protein
VDACGGDNEAMPDLILIWKPPGDMEEDTRRVEHAAEGDQPQYLGGHALLRIIARRTAVAPSGDRRGWPWTPSASSWRAMPLSDSPRHASGRANLCMKAGAADLPQEGISGR